MYRLLMILALALLPLALSACGTSDQNAPESVEAPAVSEEAVSEEEEAAEEADAEEQAVDEEQDSMAEDAAEVDQYTRDVYAQVEVLFNAAAEVRSKLQELNDDMTLRGDAIWTTEVAAQLSLLTEGAEALRALEMPVGGEDVQAISSELAADADTIVTGVTAGVDELDGEAIVVGVEAMDSMTGRASELGAALGILRVSRGLPSAFPEDGTGTEPSDQSSGTTADAKAVDEYTRAIFTILQEVVVAMTAAGTGMSELGEDASMLTDEDWKLGMAVQLTALSQGADGLRSLAVPPGGEDVEAITDELSSSIDLAVEGITLGVDELNMEALASASEAITRFGPLTQELADAMLALREANGLPPTMD